MDELMDPRWTIAELGEWVAEALSVDYRGPANGQVRAVPNQRSIRYYNTLGLLDRALEVRGRTAYYGLRHLLQLVAIKRLQAAGRSLDEVQGVLAGLPDTELAELARLPHEITRVLSTRGRRPDPERQAQTGDAESPAVGPHASRRRQRFWATDGSSRGSGGAPAAPAAGEYTPADAAPGTAKADAASTASEARPLDRALTFQRLARIALGDESGAPGVSLVFAPARRIDDGDLAAIRDALAPLVEMLAERGLLGDDPARTLERPGAVPEVVPEVDDR